MTCENRVLATSGSVCPAPNILLEAMSSGLPVACSSRGPMPEVLGPDGVFFDPENREEISMALKKLIEDRDLRIRNASSAHERALAYSWERCASDTFAFIRRIADRSGISHEG